MILVSVEPYFTADWLTTRAAFWEADASADRKNVYRRNVERFPDELLRRLSPRDAFAIRYVRNGFRTQRALPMLEESELFDERVIRWLDRPR